MNTLFSRDYINSNMMGPNALRLAEEVCRSLQLQPGMRVLDLACGTGMTSIYLAQAFNLEVTAMDLWIAAEDNQARFKAAGLEDRITAVNFDVTQMRPGHAPFAENSFDAVLSIDAYHYFGASSAFFDTHLAPFIKPGGQVAIVVPGLKKPFPLQQSVAPELAPWWQPGMNFFTVDRWMQLWQQSAFLQLELCEESGQCAQAWQEWLACDNPYAVRDREMMAAENGQWFNFAKMTGRIHK